MRKLTFEPVFDAPVEKLWQLFTNIENYPKYIKFCHYAKLNEEYKSGSSWYDWTTIMYFPLRVPHYIKTASLNKEIVYSIDLPLGGKMVQNLKFEDLGQKTKINVRIDINFESKIMDSLFGPSLVNRNKDMIESSIQNFKKELKNAAN